MSELFQALMAIITWLMGLTIIPEANPARYEPQPPQVIVEQSDSIIPERPVRGSWVPRVIIKYQELKGE